MVAAHVSCTKGAYLLVVARGKMPALLQNWDMPQGEETEDDNPMRLSPVAMSFSTRETMCLP